MAWTDTARKQHMRSGPRYPRWGGCRPPHTASQCAKLVELKATERQGRQPCRRILRRRGQLGTLHRVIMETIVEVGFEPFADGKRAALGDGDIAEIEQAEDVGAQQ